MRIVRRLLQVVLLLLTIVIGMSAAAMIVTQTVWFRDWLRGFVVRQGDQYLNGRLTIGRLGGNVFFGVELEDVAVTMDGEPVITIKDARIAYSVLQLLTRNLAITSLNVNRPIVYMRRQGGAWDLTRLIRPQEKRSSESNLPVTIQDITVTDGSFAFEDQPVGTSGVDVPRQVNRLDVRMSLSYSPARYSVDISKISLRGQSPPFALNALSGKVAVQGDDMHFDRVVVRTAASDLEVQGVVYNYAKDPTLDLDVASDKLDLQELASVLPALKRVDLEPALALSAKGPLNALAVKADVRAPGAGDLSSEVVANLNAPDRHVAGTVNVRNLNVASILARPEYRSDVTGAARFDLLLLSGSTASLPIRGTCSLHANVTTALGYNARDVDARCRIDQSRVAVDASARAYGARATTVGSIVLPHGRAPLAYDVRGTVVGADLRLLPRSLKLPRPDSHLNVDYHLAGSGSTIRTDEVMHASTLAGAEIGEGTVTTFGYGGGQATYSATGTIGNIDLERIGREMHIAALRDARYKSDANARFQVSGSGTTLADMRLDAKANLWNVAPSAIAGLHIDQISLEGQYANRGATIRNLSVTGPDVRMTATGAITLADQGASNLNYHFETPALDRIGKLIDEPIQGAATLNGHVAGNGHELRAAGTVKASNVAYGSSQALEMTSQYDVALPSLEPANVQVHATTTATFVKAAGQEINRIVATTTLANESLDFDANLEQPKRALNVAGNLVLHPQHDEVHLRRLALKSGGVSWQMAPGSQPAIQYAGDSITVRDVRLISSGTQEISAEGTIGPKASNLRARVSNFDLANVDALMLTDRQLGGVLNAQATITGPRDALDVAGRFAVSPGSFRRFKYQSFNGSVKFAHDRIDLDVKLQEDAQAAIEAKGTLPTSLFAPKPAGAAAAERVDLHVQSTPVDLGLIQGFTTDVQNAVGTVQASLAVAGTAGDPDMSGAIDIRGGGFKIVPTNVTYTALNAHVALQPDRLTVQNMSISDEHGHALDVTGDLALPGRQLGDFNVKVRGSQFEILHNEFGRIRFDPDVTVKGQLQQPTITGTLALYTGTVNLDRILEQLGSSPYSTTAETVAMSEGGEPIAVPIGQPVNQPAATTETARAEAKPGPPAAQPNAVPVPKPAPSSPFDAASIDLHVKVPDDLVVKGNDIRVGQSSMGLGNVNITIGGDIHVQKPPGAPIKLLGQVQAIRGTYDFQGRRFDIQRGGTVRFEGFEPPDPALDLTATRLITGVETRVHVGGTVRRPRLTLSSNPPLDEADILSLIVFGQPANQLGEGQQISLAQRAGAIASGFVAGKLAQSIGNALNLDTFEIQTATSDTGQAGATVTVGEQVGQRLYVKLRQGVGADNASEFVVDYQLTDFLRFETTMTQGGTPTRNIMQRVQQSGADLIFMFSY